MLNEKILIQEKQAEDNIRNPTNQRHYLPTRWCSCIYFLQSIILYCCCCSIFQLCLTLCGPMDCSTPGFPVLHHLLEFAPTHVHLLGDAIQPSPPTFNLSQRVSSLHQVAKVLEFQLQHHFFQWMFRTDFFRIDWFDLLAVQGTLKSLLQHHSSKSFGTQPSLWSNYIILYSWGYARLKISILLLLFHWTLHIMNIQNECLWMFPLQLPRIYPSSLD